MAKGKILIMDDEDLVLGVARALLEALGYQVVEARNGEEALALYHSHRCAGQPFDAAILDWKVPEGMDGFETMQRLRALDPEAKGILSSGDLAQTAEARVAAGFMDEIGKPYDLTALRETLARVLGKAPHLGLNH